MLFVTIAFHTSPSMRHHEVVDKSLRKICQYERNVQINAYPHDTSFDFRDL